MILSGGAEIDRNAYPLHMIRENAIPGFLRCRTEEMDGELLFCYDITSLQTLQSVMENQEADAALLRMLFLLIPDAMETLSEYLLDPQGLLLSPDMIFLNREKNQMRFCYYPGAEAGLATSLQQLGEGILPRLDHKDREAVILGYAFYQKCCDQTEEVPVDFFRNMLRETGPEDPAEQREEAEEEQSRQEEIVNAFFEEDDREAKKNGRRKSGKKKSGKSGGKADRQSGRKKFSFFQKFRRKEPAQEDLEWQTAYEKADTAAGRKEVPRAEKLAENEINAYEQAENGINVYDEEAETQILKAYAAGGGVIPVPAKLVYVGAARKDTKVFLQPGQEFALNQPMYVIGKSSRAADVVLPSPAVSRSHARIAWGSSDDDSSSRDVTNGRHDGQFGIAWSEPDHNLTSGLRTHADSDNGLWEGYVLRDLHSKNGTAVNGRMLDPEEELPLHDGDEILFADLIFRYIIGDMQENR